MKKCGLLGRKLGHSYSPAIHAFLGDYSYQLFEKEPEELPDFLRNGDFDAINVTIPYKKDVIPYLDELSPVAKKLGAVNTVVRRTDGSLIGHNTDYYGFRSMLARSGLDCRSKKVLVLGSGGASATVCAVLEEAGANVVVISRTGENNYGNLHLHADAAILVNTTPVGMYPNVGESTVELESFPGLEGVLDIIYNPARTKLLLDAEEKGLVTMNGLWMLVAQAKEASEWFTGNKLDDSLITAIHAKLRRRMENYILIGMPGCGKSTIAAHLAKLTRREDKVVDADAMIEKLAGKTIPEIFAEDGEAGFRTLETQVLGELGRQSGLIIATGGGCVTKPENYPLLHQNGILIWLQRDTSLLPTEGRPLSQQNRLEDLYRLRKPLYEAFADCTVRNDRPPEEIALEITKALEALQ